jgi:alpha-tubulin suppressor-like RCC1 family protein
LRPGGEHVCGITADHRVLCWGNNASGQLGDNSTTNRSTPVVVQWSFPRVP